MNDPIIVQIFKGDADRTLLHLYKAPNCNFANVGMKLFDCDMTGLTSFSTPDSVKLHGQHLLNSLMQSHQMIGNALQSAFQLDNGACRPIYFEMVSLPAAESFCWEALCQNDGTFLALDRRWPVARVASTRKATREVQKYEAPLKMMVVLSASGLDPRREWNSIYKAVVDARKQGLPIILHVGTGDEALQDEIYQACALDANLQQFTLNNMVDLIETADKIQPHLLHFFCHGSASLGKPRLEISTINDLDARSIEVTLPDLLGSPGVLNCWLAVLNCCESGATTSDLPSLSQSLVAGGVHTAIGMKDEVSVVDAAVFSEQLYPALLDNLRTTLNSLDEDTDAVIEWSSSMWAPRKRLSLAKGKVNKLQSWTLPVIYVQLEPFRVRRGAAATAAAAAAAARIRTIQEFLAHVPENMRSLLEEELYADAGKG